VIIKFKKAGQNDNFPIIPKISLNCPLPLSFSPQRSWTIWYPDFSLHYEFHFGAVDGHSFSLKGNVVLPHWAQLEPEEELALVDMEEKVEFGRLKYGQWKLMDEKVVVVLSGGSPMVRKMYG
jgi:hypothetical protein